MPKSKKPADMPDADKGPLDGETTTRIATAIGEEAKVRADLVNATAPKVVENPIKPRILGGICEFCGAGVECIHHSPDELAKERLDGIRA